MKNIFKGYYHLDKEEFKSLWESSLFIFDTNVLLNLYRYQSSTRDTLLKVMEKLGERVWIPYHVGLEFQRNRLKVIAEQHKRFSEVRGIVSKSISGMKNEFDGLQLKKRHSHINPDQLLANIEKVQSDFFEELNKLEEKSISVNSDDEIRNRIDSLFGNSIGAPPEDQKSIDELFSEGENRYKNNIPPGYKDSSKDDKNPDEFTYSGLTYKRKYGDLIIWKQIISHAANNDLKNIIFITDDNKADWWWKVDSGGSKTIGVRPELKDEIYREAKVENFHVYNTEGFLSYANEQLNAQVTEEAIEEVREISDERQEAMLRHRMLRQMSESTERAVYEWLSHNFSHLEHHRHRDGGLDFIGYRDEHKYGFEVRLVQNPRAVMHRLQEKIFRSYYLLNEERFYEVAIIFVVLNEEAIPELEHHIRRRMPEVQGNLRIIIGRAEYSEEEGYVYGFIPYTDFQLGHRM
ncbi:PIN domain-containing protein [Gilvimarinus agarilyticus]|uniref:PIN domain-containing protein n=1 Tax=Gilvimarinus agarilyticus TaxID=679259 RepID=UPI000697D25F|nr:PIN domain-containing protein [Gilvimarinus agarilyticus]